MSARRRGLVRCVWAIIALLLGTTAHATTQDTTAAMAPDDDEEHGWLAGLSRAAAQAHETVSRWADWTVLRLDQFFTDPADGPTEPPEYSLRLRLMSRVERGEEPEVGAGFSVRLELPHLEKRWRVFLDNLRRDELPGAQEQPEEPGRRDFNTGVGVDLVRRLASRLSADAGASFDPMPRAFAEIRFRHYFLDEPWKAMFAQRGYWKSEKGFGEITSLDVIRRFGTNLIARSNTAAKWAEDTEGVEAQQTFSLDRFFQIRGRKATPSFTVYGHVANGEAVDGYQARLAWRTPFCKRWMYLNVSPQVEFPRERDFKFTPSLWVALDLYAGALPEE